MTEAALSAASAHWGLDAAAPQLIAARENRVYRAQIAGTPVALRLHRPGYRTADELRSELHWMQMPATSGMPVPAPVPAQDGSLVWVQGDLVVDVLTWVGGAPMSAAQVGLQTYTALGALMAQMHDLADAWTPPAGFTRPFWDLVGEAPLWDRFWDNPHLTTAQRETLLRFRDYAREALAGLQDPDIGLIHADLVPDNVLLDAGRVVPIDFDDGGFGHRLFDVVTVTFRSKRDDPTGAAAAAVVAGYTSLRPLDLSHLPLFEALRACSYVGWNIARLEEDGARARNARFVDAALHSVADLPKGATKA